MSSFGGGTRPTVDPLSDLRRLIDEEQLQLDCILCPGDITNKANSNAFNYVWPRLHDLANELGIPLVSTVGNHDVDSRYKTSTFDPRDFAKAIVPPIPFGDRQNYLEFWAEDFTSISLDDCNILALNTAAYHGAGRDTAAEIEHGRISPRTIEAIKTKLSTLPSASTNILLCHHHPLQPEQSDENLAGLTRGGSELIRVLNDAPTSWILIHGHKHVPDLFYGHGGANSPVIVSCASFSAQINFDAQNKNPNQVHLLTSDPSGARQSGWNSAGTILSWTWQPGVGWKKSFGPHGLRHVCGFGHRASAASLVDQIDAYYTTQSVNSLAWTTAIATFPSLMRLVPSDFRALERELEQRGFVILTDRDGSYAQLGRRP